jgi:hypothetical protein
MLRISKKISSVSLKRFPARILWCCCKHESDLTCKTNILYGTCGHVENPEIIFFLEILQQKKNLTWRDFFGPVAFGQANYIFILASVVLCFNYTPFRNLFLQIC